MLWAAKTHLLPASSTYRAFSTELPNTLIKLMRPYQLCCIFTTKMMSLLISQPHLPVMNGNNPRSGTDLGAVPEEMWKGAIWTSHHLEVTLGLQESPWAHSDPANSLLAC